MERPTNVPKMLSGPVAREGTCGLAPGDLARIPHGDAASCDVLETSAIETAVARRAESGQIAPESDGADCRDLWGSVWRDRGTLFCLVLVVLGFLFAPGCAPAPAATPVVSVNWCDHCERLGPR